MIRAILIAISVTLAVTVFGFLVWPGWLPQAREDGAATERLKWLAAKEVADAKRDAAVAGAQRKIDDAEGEMLNTNISTRLKVEALQAALDAERKANDKPKTEVSDKGTPLCRPRRMPDRVRNALNAFRGQ